MRFEFERAKSRDGKQKHGISLKEAQEIFDQVYVVDKRSDNPRQHSVPSDGARQPVFRHLEVRHDSEGE